jgi:lambda repressor-like predicted transcriptional regulator
MATDHEIRMRALETRLEAVLGGWGATSRLSRALGVETSTLHRQFSGQLKRYPTELEVIAELLELLPQDKWPRRWHKK